jgi:predicted enzyme related to lactoylglutathione lyase
MAIGELRCVVIDVEDLDVAERFWSEVTGIPVIPSPWPGRFSYLGADDPWKHEVILHRVETRKDPMPNRCHIDITAPDMDAAIEQIDAIGGRLKRAPSIYPRPGSSAGPIPLIEWAVMQDPFGNEFCIVIDLTRDERYALKQAAPDVTADDRHWRVIAGRKDARSYPPELHDSQSRRHS